MSSNQVNRSCEVVATIIKKGNLMATHTYYWAVHCPASAGDAFAAANLGFGGLPLESITPLTSVNFQMTFQYTLGGLLAGINVKDIGGEGHAFFAVNVSYGEHSSPSYPFVNLQITGFSCSTWVKLNRDDTNVFARSHPKCRINPNDRTDPGICNPPNQPIP